MVHFVITYWIWVWLIPARIVGGATGYLPTRSRITKVAEDAAETKAAEDVRAAEAKAAEDARRAVEATTGLMAQDEFRAFISYRRKDAGGVGRWLRNRLISYSPPRLLLESLPAQQRQTFAERRNFYLDTAYSRANEDFWNSNIEPALRTSKYLVVISSEGAFESRLDGTENWVAREIDCFHSIHGDSGRIMLALAPGAPTDRFPGRLATLSERWDWADFRGYTLPLWRWLNMPRAAKLDDEFLKIVAAIFDVPSHLLPILRQEEARRRLRVTSAAIAALFVIASAFAGLFGWAEINRSEAVTQRNRALTQLQQTQIAQSRLLATISQQRTASGDATAGMLLALDALPHSRTDGRPIITAALAALMQASLEIRERMVLRQGPSRDIAFSPDGSTLAVASNEEIGLWDMATGQSRLTLRRQRRFSAVLSHTLSFSPDGRTLAIVSGDTMAQLWNTETGTTRAVLKHEGLVTALIFSPDNRLVATASDHTVQLWDGETGASRLVLKHVHPIRSVAFSPDGRVLATVSSDNIARLWDLETGESRGVFEHQKEVYVVTFSSSGNALAVGLDGGTQIWDVPTNLRRAVLTQEGAIRKIAFSPDQHTLATGSDATVQLWDFDTGESHTVLKVEGTINALAFAPDGDTLATASNNDNSARLWDVTTGRNYAILRHSHTLYAAAVYNVLFSPDGRRLATVSLDGTARIWDAKSDQARTIFKLTSSGDSLSDLERLLIGIAPHTVAFSPDDLTLATALGGNVAQLWDVATGVSRAVLNHDSSIYALAFSPTGNILATAALDNTARLWDAASGANRAILRYERSVKESIPDPVDPPNGLVFSPDGRTLATASGGETAQLWDVAAGISRTIISNGGNTNAASFSPDGRTLATASSDDMVRLWDVETGNLRIEFRQEDTADHVVAFSRDGRILATGTSQGTIRLWDIAGNREQTTIQHPGSVEALDFSPDGHILAIRTLANSVVLWDVVTSRERAVLRHDEQVRFLAFSPDGRVLAAISGENVQIWDVATGESLGRLIGHAQLGGSLSFSPDGRSIAIAMANGPLRLAVIPPIDPFDLIDYARKKLPLGRMELTGEELEGATKPLK
jgi:WD40 repeat protein